VGDSTFFDGDFLGDSSSSDSSSLESSSSLVFIFGVLVPLISSFFTFAVLTSPLTDTLDSSFLVGDSTFFDGDFLGDSSSSDSSSLESSSSSSLVLIFGVSVPVASFFFPFEVFISPLTDTFGSSVFFLASDSTFLVGDFLGGSSSDSSSLESSSSSLLAAVVSAISAVVSPIVVFSSSLSLSSSSSSLSFSSA